MVCWTGEQLEPMLAVILSTALYLLFLLLPAGGLLSPVYCPMGH